MYLKQYCTILTSEKAINSTPFPAYYVALDSFIEKGKLNKI